MKAFECKKCGACCYGKGGIPVTHQEMESIAAFLHISLETLEAIYCETRNRKTYVRSGADGFCILFDREKLCLVHPVKPRPCRLWPFYPALLKDKANWRAAMDACPGINPDALHEDFVKEAGT